MYSLGNSSDFFQEEFFKEKGQLLHSSRNKFLVKHQGHEISYRWLDEYFFTHTHTSLNPPTTS